MAKNSVQVTILGQKYTISGDATVPEIIKLAEDVDRDIKETMEKNPRASMITAAVLVAMTYRDEKQKSDAKAEDLYKHMMTYYDEKEKLSIELSAERKTTEDQRAQIIVLRDKLSRAKKK